MRTILAASALILALSAQAYAQQVTDPRPANAESDVTVPGVIERPVPRPPGDPRTASQRMRDIRGWDKCVLAAQRGADADPLRPQMDTPEEYCRTRLGMRNRLSVPFDTPVNN